jgi:hypothetical protein
MSEGAGHKAGEAMGKMEETLGELQDDVAYAKTPPANHFKPLWLLTAIVVVLLIGGATFLAVEGLTNVDRNAKAIFENCERRNAQLMSVNEKFQQLNTLIEVLTEATPSGALSQPEARTAYEAFKKPIPLIECRTLK